VLYEPSVAASVEPVAAKLGIAHRWLIGAGGRRLLSWRDERGLEAKLPLPDPDSLATLQYTGGTTGRSKGVNVTHRAYAYNISQREALMPSRPDAERILCVMPLFHVYASHVCLHTAAYARGTMVVMPRYHPEETVKALAAEKITIFAGSPTIYTSLLSYQGFARADLSSLYYSVSGSAALPATVLQQWEARVGTPIGYRNLPKETAATLRGGWLYTGDIGEFDADGYFYIRDRKKEMVIVSGYNVFPREVEIVLYQHPAVREAGVIGVPDTYRGEIVKAFVALKPGAAATPDGLLDHCRANLAKYKIPAALEIVPDLPKTAVGKIDKKQLKGA
jgi:long-chain acyl-CoA synthetase